jgi:RimJ/RimL family protein N-acetyltransferase
VPTFVRALADNQRQLVRDTAERGAIYAPDANEPAVDAAFIGRHLHALMENTGLRRSIARAGMALVDGRGVMRVLRHLDLTGITLRQAREQDSSQLFAWRNDASIRAVSRHHDPIDWTSHERWFQSVAADPQRALLIGERHGRDVGVVRLDIDHSQAEVSIYLVPGHTGHGTGGDLLHAAERWLRSSHPAVRELKAQVLGPNTVSHRLFAGGRYNVDYVAYRKVMC